MIKVDKHSKNVIDKNDIVVKSELSHQVKVFVIKFYDNNQSQNTEVEESDGKKGVGFGNK